MTEEEKKAIEYLQDSLKNTVTHKEKLNVILNLIQKQQTELEKKNKMIELIKEEIRDHIGFENRLKRDNREPDMFNQGRFYVANNINNILKGK